MVKIIILNNNNTFREFNLYDKEIVIGSGSLGIRIPDGKNIDETHCEIIYDKKEKVYKLKKITSNQIFVNDNLISLPEPLGKENIVKFQNSNYSLKILITEEAQASNQMESKDDTIQYDNLFEESITKDDQLKELEQFLNFTGNFLLYTNMSQVKNEISKIIKNYKIPFGYMAILLMDKDEGKLKIVYEESKNYENKVTPSGTLINQSIKNKKVILNVPSESISESMINLKSILVVPIGDGYEYFGAIYLHSEVNNYRYSQLHVKILYTLSTLLGLRYSLDTHKEMIKNLA